MKTKRKLPQNLLPAVRPWGRRRARVKKEIFYPDSDGQPMAQNPRQFELIVKIQANLKEYYAEDENVWIGQDQFWYPVEGFPKINQAPDVFLVFGRPKKYRPHYQQWLEAGVSPQVVFEILSPTNSLTEMAKKLIFYEKYGVEEYYMIDPDFRLLKNGLAAYLRTPAKRLVQQPVTDTFVSPRMKIWITADKKQEDFEFYLPDGSRFVTETELRADKKRAEQFAEEARLAQVQTLLEKEAAERRAEELALEKEAAERRAEELALQEEAAERRAEELALQEKAAERRAEELTLQEEAAERRAEQAVLQEKLAERRAEELVLQEEAAERRAEQAILSEEAAERRAEQAVLSKEAAERRAEQAILTAERERLEKENLANYLRKLGLDPNNLP